MTLAEQFPYCVICPIIENPPPEEAGLRIHEGEYWRVALRGANQALLGASYITLKDHKESLADLSAAEDDEFVVIRNRLIRAVGAAFDPDGINLTCLMNDAFLPTSDPDFVPQPHIHYHFYPRYKDERTVGGVTFRDPEFGQYLRGSDVQPASPALARAIVSNIQQHF